MRIRGHRGIAFHGWLEGVVAAPASAVSAIRCTTEKEVPGGFKRTGSFEFRVQDLAKNKGVLLDNGPSEEAVFVQPIGW